MSSPPRNPILRKVVDSAIRRSSSRPPRTTQRSSKPARPTRWRWATRSNEHSLLTLDQDRHLSHRKLLLPPSHCESVRRYADVLADAAEAEVERWPLGRPFALRPRMHAIGEVPGSDQ